MSDLVPESLAAPRAAVKHSDDVPSPTGLRPIADDRTAHPAPTTQDQLRWDEIDRQLGTQISGRRVLVVGPNTDYDAAAFAARGAEQVLAGATHLQLDPTHDGTFEIVHCNDLLHRVLEPLALLQTLRRVTARDGTLLIGSLMIADPERSEYLRFIPDRYAGDPACWFVPGRLAFRWLVQTAGFAIEAAFAEREGPEDCIPVVTGYLRATPR